LSGLANSSDAGIYELRVKDHHLRRLTRGEDRDPASSAAGAIAFVRHAENGTDWIYAVRRPGAKPRRMLRGADPDWSPDGKRLAFAARDGGLYTSGASGARPKRLTTNNTLNGDREPVWSPSGSRIAFVRFPHIYIVRRDGSHLHQVATGASQSRFWESPSWQPLKGKGRALRISGLQPQG
jgi:TolB protein